MVFGHADAKLAFSFNQLSFHGTASAKISLAGHSSLHTPQWKDSSG
jgi:hypothetical protein